ncbi:MAG: hypothetical protein E8D52_05980 [Nitrospira sp.]|nr:MAG: hypothetical protein E8D52_05980 [Nitrospira sp.]
MPKRKKKPVNDAKRAGQPSIFQHAWVAWTRGDRNPLRQILDLHENQIPPQLYDILYAIVEHASMPTQPMAKRKPGRPKVSTRYHSDTQRDEIVRTVAWLRKIKPSMTVTRAREVVADRYGISTSLVEKYCLALRKS